MKDDREKQCNFRFEDQVDRILEKVHSEHLDIPMYIRQAEMRLAAEKEAGTQSGLQWCRTV
jgi:hypothetical protein